MKRLISIVLILSLVFALSACSYDVIDMTYNYNYAYIELPDGQIVAGKIESWRDFEGEQLQVKINGITYLTSSYHCTLIYDSALN
jgi:hypothetical protein